MEVDDALTLRFASLLHDIGKFWQGAGERGKHAHLGAKFVRQYLPQLEKAASLISLHHDAERYGEEYRLLKILALADWLSSGERKEIDEEKEEGKRKETPLLSIFSEVQLEGKGEAQKMYLTPTIYDPMQPIYPSTQIGNISSSYIALWELFIKDINKIKIESLDRLFETIFHIIKKYCLLIPSAVYKSIPDISLFDHAKTTCAIADCLYQVADLKYLDTLINALRKEKEEANEKEKEALNEEKFLLIGGDISGIQKFIYTIVPKGAVKGLKGRSFHLQILSEILARYIVEKLGLSIANIIYCAGGHFYILAPINAQDELNIIRKEISNRLFEIYKGRIYLALDAIPLSAKDFLLEGGKTRLAEKWEELTGILHKRKKKKFEEILDMKIFEGIEAKEVCKICGMPLRENEFIKDDEGNIKCNLCDGFEKLAEEVKETEGKYMIIRKTTEIEKEWNKPFSYFGYAISFSKEIQDDCIVAYKLNDTVFEEIEKPIGFYFYFETGNPDVDSLANEATGLKRWGILKGDVDNLGKIFSSGLKDPTLSRISTLSTMLSFFFGGMINKVHENYKGKLYGVYSGGDDFFIIGSWDVLPDLAKDIYNDFRKFTCNNPSITLSIAISIAPSIKYPVYKLADIVTNELDEKAKKHGKDAIAFLGKAIKWSKFEEIKNLKDEIYKGIENGLSKGFLQKLYGIYFLYKKAERNMGKEIAKYDDRVGRWRWILSYILAREKSLKRGEKEKWREMIGENIEYLDVAVRWVEFLEREEVMKGE